MTLHSFVGRLTQLVSWLYYQHQWEEWELLAIASAALVPLLLIARQQRKESAGRIYTHHDGERSPIIGVKLADGKRGRSEITDSKKARLGYFARRRNKQDDATKQVHSSNEQIRQLQCEIAKCRQVEARLEQQLAELTAANEKLQHEISESKQTEERLQQQTIKLLAANKKLQEGLPHKRIEGFLKKQADSVPAANKHPRSNDAEDMQAEEHPRRQALELLATDKLPPDSLNPRDQDTGVLRENPKRPTDSRHTNEPLDVEKLKAIAALARQIQERPRPKLRQTEPQASD